MATIYDKYNKSAAATVEELLDVFLCVSRAVESKGIMQFSPEMIQIKENGECVCLEGIECNMYYAAPEVVVDGKIPDKNSRLFSIGMLLHFVWNGCSYYEKNCSCLVELPEKLAKDEGLICEKILNSDDEYAILQEGLMKLTSWNPAHRYEGFELWLEIAREYSSIVKIDFICHNRTVASTNYRVKYPWREIKAGTIISGMDGKSYKVCDKQQIPFRLGNYQYSIKVSEE